MSPLFDDDSESEIDTCLISNSATQITSSHNLGSQSVTFILDQENKKLLAEMLEKSKNNEFPK